MAPALVRHSEVYAYREHPKAGAPAWYLPNLYGNLHARQEWEMFAPVMVGDAINTRSFIADRYVKRGRDYVVNEVLYFDADGARRARAGARTRASCARRTTSGIVIDKTREKASGRTFEVDTAARDRGDPGAAEADLARYVLEVQRPAEATTTTTRRWR